MRHISSAALWLALPLLLIACGARAGIDAKHPELHQVFPQATRFGDIEGVPPAAAVYRGDKVIGYAFETVMVAPVPAYSGAPINLLVSIDADGVIRDARVLEQHEPILLVGIPVQKLYDFVARYIGHRVDDRIVVGGGAAGTVRIDAISSATVTSMVANETIMNSALKVAASRRLVAGAGEDGKAAAVRAGYFVPADWHALTENGAIGRLHLERHEVAEAFKGEPESGLADDPTAALPGHGDDPFIDLYFADVTPPTVGRNLLGADAYAGLMKHLQPGDSAIAVMANGIYSFKGLGYVRGGIFDRVHLLQDGKLVLFKDADLVPMGESPLRGKPAFAEQAIFIVRNAGSGFDATRPWTLQLLVNRQVGPLQSLYHTFTRDYRMPAVYTTRPDAADAGRRAALPDDGSPLWREVWHARRLDIALLLAGLGVLTLILVFQDWIVRRPKLLERVRVGFLVYTLVFIGWYGLAQLSVVNIFTFVQSLLHGFRWQTFLMDPLIFIMWVFVAATLLLLGRGVYCGWLCPFGALQILVSKLAVRLRVPQFEFPSVVHERLWALKYIILLALFGISLQSLNAAEHYAEIEPFKTAITLHFARSWGYVLFAAALVAVSAFNHKFYCRYVCPLGAGLAVSGRFHLLEWLRRRPECGHPCQVCAHECEMRAILPDGRIDFNECHYSLDCQVTYADDHKCPPLVQQRKKRERAARPLPTPVVTITSAAMPDKREPAEAAD
jgi:NosR/NirI family nitrous oxide reductase transcriptional regulator